MSGEMFYKYVQNFEQTHIRGLEAKSFVSYVKRTFIGHRL